MPNLGPMEIAIIALVVLLLFGGSKLAGLGKSTGRALREFKEETKGLRDADNSDGDDSEPAGESAGSGAPRKDEVTRELTRGPQDPVEGEVHRSEDRHRDV